MLHRYMGMPASMGYKDPSNNALKAKKHFLAMYKYKSHANICIESQIMIASLYIYKKNKNN